MGNAKSVSALMVAVGFLLGSFRGYVALWDEDRPDPIQIFPCPVENLPEEDRQALEKGVPARSRLELDRLMEDYLS